MTPDALAVLLIDDESEVLDTLALALANIDAPLLRADGVEPALALIRSDPRIAVIISDIRMPGRSGLELLAAVQATRTEAEAVEVIMVSGHASLDDLTTAIRGGAVDFLRKPFRLQELLDAVQRAFTRARARRAADALTASQENSLRAVRAELAGLAASAGPATPDEPTGTIQDRLQRLAQLSHDLRTPLMPVLGFAELMRDGTVHPDLVRSYSAEISRGAQELLQVADRLISMLMLNLTAQSLVWQSMPALPLVHLAWAAVAEQAAAQAVTLAAPISKTSKLRLDPALWGRALMQVFSTALHHARHGTSLRVELADQPGQHRVTVWYDGPCPAQPLAENGNTQPSAEFAPSRRLLPAAEPSDNDNDNALAIAGKILALHGGSLAVASPSTGGALLTLSWPSA